MNKSILFLIFITFISSNSFTQSRSGFELLLQAGATIPTGNLTKSSSTGFYGGVELDFNILENVNIFASGGYNSFSLDDERTILANGNIAQTGLGVRYVIPTYTYKLFFKLGVSMNFYEELVRDASGMLTDQSRRTTNPGLMASSGYMYKVSPNVDLLTQIGYNQIFDDENDINFLQISAGVVIGF